MIASAGLSGGLSSSIAGGSFWAGARQGVIVATMNHLAHMGFDKSGESLDGEDDIDQEDPPTKKKPTLDEIARSEGYTNHQFKLLYELNEFFLKAANFRAELTTFGTVTRGAKLLPLLSRSKIAVTFGENANQLNHTFRHVEALGLSRDVVKTAVLNHIPKIAKNLPFGVSVNTRIVVSGQEIIYSSYKLPSGVINVGRITGP